MIIIPFKEHEVVRKSKSHPKAHAFFPTRTQSKQEKQVISDLALGGLQGTSGSNSTGSPRNPWNRSKVTCATCCTSVGHPISMEPKSSSSTPSGLHPSSDFRNNVSSSANTDSCCSSTPSPLLVSLFLSIAPPAPSLSFSSSSPPRRMPLEGLKRPFEPSFGSQEMVRLGDEAKWEGDRSTSAIAWYYEDKSGGGWGGPNSKFQY